eukprot:128751-Pleurochrysis_carterae.AAC.4
MRKSSTGNRRWRGRYCVASSWAGGEARNRSETSTPPSEVLSPRKLCSERLRHLATAGKEAFDIGPYQL